MALLKLTWGTKSEAHFHQIYIAELINKELDYQQFIIHSDYL